MKIRLQKLNQLGFDHVLVALAFVVVMALGGTYYLLNQSHAASPWSGALKVNMSGTNLCMENMANSTTAYTSQILNTCSGSKQAQHFSIKPTSGSNFQIVAAASGACLDDPAGKIGTNANNRVYVETWPCSTSDTAQVWHWGGAGNHQLVNVRSGGCVNDPASSKAAGTVSTRLIVFSCTASGGNGGNAQWLEVANTGTGTSTGSGGGTVSVVGKRLSVGPQGSNYCMDTASVKQSGNVVINQCSATKASQGWKFVSAGSYKYVVGGVNKSLALTVVQNTTSGTSQCLDNWGQSTTSGNQLRLYSCKTTDRAQQFFWTGDGHQLRSFSAFLESNKVALCIDDKGAVKSANNPVNLSTCKATGQSNQDWYKI